MQTTPPTPTEIQEHVSFVLAEVRTLLAKHSVAARVEPHELRGVRRVIVTLDLNRLVLHRPAP